MHMRTRCLNTSNIHTDTTRISTQLSHINIRNTHTHYRVTHTLYTNAHTDMHIHHTLTHTDIHRFHALTLTHTRVRAHTTRTGTHQILYTNICIISKTAGSKYQRFFPFFSSVKVIQLLVILPTSL